MTQQNSKHILISLMLLVITSVPVDDCYADGSISAFMQRMKSKEAVKIAYQEKRILELLDRPWQGSGYMYSMPPYIMLKEQLLPERLLMGISGNRIFYFDPGHNLRHQGELGEGDPVTLNIAVFKALMNADEKLLNSIYYVKFASGGAGAWEMTLSDRNDQSSVFNIVISGLPGQQADRVAIKQADGDRIEYQLKKEASGHEISATVSRLYRDLLGD